MAKNYKCILVISDLHLPYHKKDAFNFLRAIKKKYSIDYVVNIGDELDAHALSFHDTDPDLLYLLMILSNLNHYLLIVELIHFLLYQQSIKS